jgi:Holliday junction resolvase
MGYRRRAGGGKRDSAEAAIVDALEAVGARVWRIGGTGNPDLLCLRGGIYTPLEVKTGKGAATVNQQSIPWPIVRDVAQALMAIGVPTQAVDPVEGDWRGFRPSDPVVRAYGPPWTWVASGRPKG